MMMFNTKPWDMFKVQDSWTIKNMIQKSQLWSSSKIEIQDNNHKCNNDCEEICRRISNHD